MFFLYTYKLHVIGIEHIYKNYCYTHARAHAHPHTHTHTHLTPDNSRRVLQKPTVAQIVDVFHAFCRNKSPPVVTTIRHLNPVSNPALFNIPLILISVKKTEMSRSCSTYGGDMHTGF
jgi:hypothetical protein